jgi:hypothetical protein
MFQRLSGTLLPRGMKKPPRMNSSLLREMWRAASSLERLPVQTKTELGETLVKRVKANDAGPSEFWCLSRLGARELLYGPSNLVVPAATAARWAEALLRRPEAAEAVASIARQTNDVARDLPGPTLEAIRRSFASLPESDRLIAIVDGEETADQAWLQRVFGEELPSGLVFAAEHE